MSGALRPVEDVQTRLLAALRFFDPATSVAVEGAMRIRAPDLATWRKPNGDLLVLAPAGAEPPAGSYPVDIRPLAGGYAPRRYMLKLPRDPDPAHAADAGSLFQPVRVPMLPGPDYQPKGNLALLRVTLRRSTDNARIGGALLRLTPTAPGLQPARAITAAAGEALLAVPGMPLSSPGPGATVVPTIDAALELLIRPAQLTFAGDEAAGDAMRESLAGSEGFADPDEIEAQAGGAAMSPVTVQIGAGRSFHRLLTWTPP